MTSNNDSFQLDDICSRFDAAWSESGEPPDLSAYLEAANEESRRKLFSMLMAIDIEHRKKQSLECDERFYKARLPLYADVVEIAIAFDQTVTMVASTQESMHGTIDSEATPSSFHLQIGDRVKYFGDYELLSKIEKVGMGIVFMAKHTKLKRIVALKMILSGELATEKDVQRFQSEAEAAAMLDHVGIVPIHEFGEHNGQHYFSMGFVEGGSLADRLRDGPLPPREAAELMAGICDAVQYAHENGVIHRDLKPGNVLLDKDGQPKVTDFGLAKQVDADSELTKAGSVLGTPSYMPPEQASGNMQLVDKVSDVYSLGAILYCMLTGRPPFQASSVTETLLQVREQEPVAPRVQNPALPRDLNTITLKCLNKQPEKRYESSDALAHDLRRWLAGEPILARPTTRAEKAWKWCKRNPVITASGSLVFLLLVVMGLVYSRVQGRASLETLLTADATTVSVAADKATAHRFWT